MRPYIVTPGDTLASIAARFGADPDAIWSDPKNERLKAARPDPSVLDPGDVLYLPETKPVYLAVRIGQSNRFEAKVPTQTVKLVLRGEKPLANAAYVIRGVGDAIHGTTDGDGVLSVDVPVTVTSFLLELTDQKIAHRVLVGHLDPLSGRSGARQRLSNMGYGSAIAPLLTALGIEVDFEGHAIRAFQAANGIAATGALDDGTLDAIQKAHGA